MTDIAALTDARRSMCDLCWEDVELLAYDTAHKHVERYGGDIEEAIGEAQIVFLDVYLGKFDPSKSKFSTWLRNKIWWRLGTIARNRGKQREFAADLDEIPPQLFAHDDDDAERRWDELSEDASVLLRATIEAPREVLQAVAHGEDFGDSLMGWTVESLGWSWERLTESWTEIREALR